ncbi:MAG: amino acid ABC transporter substrate-binding protein [Deltaproteobacteria bacterium]|nr:amino acid ABC transporter substrate-binding protein [Deltaproteobacteria bacterium]
MMKIKQILALIVSFLIFHSITLAQNIDDIKYITEDYPPYNFKEDGKLKGISVDLMVLMLQKLKSKLLRSDIKLYPWARGYYYVQTTPNTCLFAMTRSRKREKLFKWVGPYSPNPIVLFALKSKNIRINSIKDLKRYQIGVVRDDISEQYLIEKGIPERNLYRVAYPEQNAKKLNIGRVDMWAYGEAVGIWIIKKSGLNPQNFEIIYHLGPTDDLYFAFHKQAPDKLIQRFQAAFDELKKEGKYQDIIDRYSK